ncbi:hypothetical protein ABIF78_007757 [Bradyrhizobium japonicum]|jgi:hypothetical protein
MAMSTLRQFVEHVAKNVSRLFDKQGHLLPMYHAIDANGNEVIFVSPSHDKDRALAMARQSLADMGATRVAYIDEAWVIDDPEGLADIDKIEREGVRRQPGRKEAIIISVEDATEGLILARREIIRHGNRAILGKLMIEEHGHVEGRMVGLLPAPARKH